LEITMRALLTLALACVTSVAAFAQQAPATGKLLVTLLDETNAVLPGGTVTLVGIDAANKGLTIAPVTTTERGQATFENLVVGRYTVKGEFTGFQTRTLPEVRVRAGENKQVLILPLDRVESSVTVARDKQTAASDRDITFGTVMTREQIEALSDDPEELKRQLMDIAGPNAKILIDSFEGRELPPKALIKSIRITRDQFAPEVHYAGELRIEILTQPGVGPVRGSVRSGFYDSALDGKNPLVGERGPARSYSYGASMSGTLINERAGFNFSFNGSDAYSTPVQYASTLGGPVRGNINLRVPNENYFFSGGMDYAMTKNHVLRMNFNGSKFNSRGGVGGFEFAERAYDNSNRNFGFYLQQNGPVGRRMVLNTRLSVTGNESKISSVVEEAAVIVNDNFSSGGAQRRGATRGRNYWLNADLDYVRGLHSFRMGIEVQHSTYKSDSQSNYLGTYVFESLEAYEAGRPRSYTRRIGDPKVKYANSQGGIYIQDDFKVRKNFTLTGGVRYEAQTHVPDALNFAPRIGFTWAPTKSGKTTLRGSWGVFYDWLSTGTYSQTLQLDGFRQREINIINPSYPDPGVAEAPATNRYLLEDDRVMAYSQRLSAGIAHTLSRRVNTNILYSYAYRYALLAGQNLNAPVNGVRPDPAFANVVLASDKGEGREHYVNVSLNVNLAPMAPTGGAPAMGPMGGAMVMHGGPGMVMVMGGPPPAQGAPGSKTPLFQWRRGLTIGSFYNYDRNTDNTDGAFSIPFSQNLQDEWGPSGFDRRHNLHASITSTMIRNLGMRFGFSGSSAPPLNIRTGFDDNGDLIFNDRPIGVGRNAARTRPTYSSSANLNYSFTLGKKTVTSGSGVQIMGSPAGLTVGQAPPSTTPRYRLNLSLNINNLFNQSIYSGFSGIQNSPNFLKPTSASGWRRITFNTSMSF
jgi:hypothetical protein